MCPAFHVTPEHEARELLNLILLLERCRGLPDATAAEQAAWSADLAGVRHRLEELLAPGLDGALLTRRLAAEAAQAVAQAGASR